MRGKNKPASMQNKKRKEKKMKVEGEIYFHSPLAGFACEWNKQI